MARTAISRVGQIVSYDSTTRAAACVDKHWLHSESEREKIESAVTSPTHMTLYSGVNFVRGA
jgi:hypothetical protein